MKVFEKLLLWIDPQLRAGPEAMAVDEWLLETIDAPVLRIYGWQGDWVSLGYFGGFAAAEAEFPGVDVVRRWTGGGMVDHRADWTYSLVVPRGERLVSARGAESYRLVHTALAKVLTDLENPVKLNGGNNQIGTGLCFENPVQYDLTDSFGRKIAGAGQRRTKLGLLHQGSVAVIANMNSEKRAERFSELLASRWEVVSFSPEPDELAHRAMARYARNGWTQRR
jgi:lipoate-protein ligase A